MGSRIINAAKTPQSVVHPVDDGYVADGYESITVVTDVRLPKTDQELSESRGLLVRPNPDPTRSGVPNFTEGNCVWIRHGNTFLLVGSNLRIILPGPMG